MFATMAKSAGYTALSFPLLVVIRVYMDYEYGQCTAQVN